VVLIHYKESARHLLFYFHQKMSVAPVITQNRINPFSVPTIQQTAAPYVTYGEVALCADPNCPVCRAQRRHKHHHKRHHHKKHKTKFWDNPVVRVESASSDVSVHSVELNERRPQVTERDLVPVNQIERQVATTTTRPTEDAWVNQKILFIN
jgi:hypothetical protein